MSLFSRKLLQLLGASSSSSNRQRVFHQSSSLYSSTTYRRSTPRKPKLVPEPEPEPEPELLPPPIPSRNVSSRSSWSATAAASVQQNKLASSQREIDKDWPRPSEIPWQAKVANTVNLIGNVQMPVQFLASPDGKYWAGTVISQEATSHSPQLWIPLIFEGDLAHIAACHVKENDYVYVAGQLSADPPPFTINQGQANVQVQVRSINFVQNSLQMEKVSVPHKQKDQAVNSSASACDRVSVNQSWKDLLAKPHEWWDIRVEKGNSTDAAFKRKDNGELLLVDETTPEWIRQKLKSLSFDQQIREESKKPAVVKNDGNAALNPWRDLINNSKEWCDCRKDKISGLLNPKFPDFKRRDGSVALWLDSAPAWVLSGLEGLEFGYQIPKTKQVKERKGLEGLEFGYQIPKTKQVKERKDDKSWKDLVENPDKWWDNRSNKRNVKAPDFKHKDTGEALWLNRSPAWVIPELPPIQPN